MKTVFISGASRGLGAIIAKTFASNNYNIIINYNKFLTKAAFVPLFRRRRSALTAVVEYSRSALRSNRRKKQKAVRQTPNRFFNHLYRNYTAKPTIAAVKALENPLRLALSTPSCPTLLSTLFRFEHFNSVDLNGCDAHGALRRFKEDVVKVV